MECNYDTSLNINNMKWNFSDTKMIESIKIALLQLEKEHHVSYNEEMEWLDGLMHRVTE